MAVLGYLAKVNRDLGVAFGAHFLHDFSTKYLIPYQWTRFQCHNLFLSEDIKQNASISSYLDS